MHLSLSCLLPVLLSAPTTYALLISPRFSVNTTAFADLVAKTDILLFQTKLPDFVATRELAIAALGEFCAFLERACGYAIHTKAPTTPHTHQLIEPSIVCHSYSPELDCRPTRLGLRRLLFVTRQPVPFPLPARMLPPRFRIPQLPEPTPLERGHAREARQ
jgi:hypothetical protein